MKNKKQLNRFASLKGLFLQSRYAKNDSNKLINGVKDMKELLIIGFVLISTQVNAATYKTPECYSKVPTTCSFDDMTLAMCNHAGKQNGAKFLISQRLYMPGGNKFATAKGDIICVVKGIKGSDPKKYNVTIQK